MKNVLIIGSRNSGTKNNPEVIARSIASNDISSRLAYWEDLVFDIKTGQVTVTIDGADIFQTSVDLVIAVGWYKLGKKLAYRDVAYSFALVLESKKIPFWNSEMGKQRSTTKLSTMVQLALAGIDVPRTAFSLTAEKIEAKFAFPYVAKAIAASRGNANFLIHNKDEARQFTDNDAYFIVQPFLENNHDLRVICFGGVPSLVLKRSRGQDANSHLNNTSQGGKADWQDLSVMDSQLLTFCEKISKISGRELAGIDLIPDATAQFGYSCLEINAVPQLTSGTDTDKKMNALQDALRNL